MVKHGREVAFMDSFSSFVKGALLNLLSLGLELQNSGALKCSGDT